MADVTTPEGRAELRERLCNLASELVGMSMDGRFDRFANCMAGAADALDTAQAQIEELERELDYVHATYAQEVAGG